MAQPNHPSTKANGASRRRFIQGMGAAAVGAIAAPTILRAAEIPATGPGSIQGDGEHKYEWMHDWLEVPANVKLGNCHGVQQDSQGRIFVHHTGTPSMLVCDTTGKVMKTWGAEYEGGAHGLQLRKEDGTEYLYLALTGQHRVVKTTLDGEVVFDLKYPKESGVYKDKDGKDSEGGYIPTNIAFVSNGDFYVADGYGTSYIHRYNIKGEYQNSFGGKGKEPGKMHCCHGIYTDDRSGTELLAVADRENHRIQYFTPDGKHHSFVMGAADDNGILRRPCHFHIRGTDMLIPDLRGRITILDKDNKAVAELFDNANPKYRANNGVPKNEWADGQFICPHGAIWDSKGDIYVVEWVGPGRVTKLRHVV
jgi:hypothetical protein